MQSLIKNLVVSGLTLFAVTGGVLQGYSQPTTGGPTPTLPQGQVISVWNSSNTYTNIPVPGGYFNDWYNPGYTGGVGLYDVSGGGGVNVLYYPDPIIIWGIDFTANPYNVSGCTNLHVDVWSPTATTYDIRLINTVGGTQQADATGVIVTSGWNSLNIPLSVFTTANPSLSLNAIDQIRILGDNTANSTYYIDNIYFSAGTNLVYTPPPAVPAPTNNAPTPTQPAGNVLALYNSSGTYSDWPVVEFPASWSGSPQTSFTITNTGSVVQYLSGLLFVGDTYYSNPINTTPFNTMHIDLWTGKGNQFYIQLVSVTPNTQAAQVGVFNMPTNQWAGIDIPISQFAAANPNTDLTDIQQVLWVDNVGPGLQGTDFYFDNVYFYNKPSAPAVTVSVTGGTFKLSFSTQNGFNYTVQYKTNLTDAAWQTLSSVSGNGSTQMVTDPANQKSRFYRLSVQ